MLRSNVFKIYLILLNLSLFSKNEDFLSFIVPCYNCAQTVEESLESIYNQNLKIPFEVVCTDDCSTDNTLTLLREYQSKYNNFFVFRHDTNKGGGAARNTCVKNSKGNLIFCLDSDNILVRDSVQKLVNFLNDLKIEAAAFEELKFFRGNLNYSHSWVFKAPNDITDLKLFLHSHINIPSSGNYLYTRESYLNAGGYPEGVGLDTWGFGLRQYATNSRIAILKNSFYWHRRSENSYWDRENVNGKLTQEVVYDLIFEFIEIFTPDTINSLTQYRNNRLDYFDLIQNKKEFDLVSSEQLNNLFNGYKLKNLISIK